MNENQFTSTIVNQGKPFTFKNQECEAFMPSLSEPVGRFYSLVPNDNPSDDPLNNLYECGQSVHIPIKYGLVGENYHPCQIWH